MLIGEVAGALGVHSHTIRFYEKQGLLPAPHRQPNGYRTYDPAIVSRVNFIQSSQAAGLTLSEIMSVLSLRECRAGTLHSRIHPAGTQIRSCPRASTRTRSPGRRTHQTHPHQPGTSPVRLQREGHLQHHRWQQEQPGREPLAIGSVTHSCAVTGIFGLTSFESVAFDPPVESRLDAPTVSYR